MKRTLLSITSLIFAGTVLVSATGAFFSDTETSSANTFAAGDIDLKIDNESYYNGAVSSSTSWSLVDLTVEKFFNFLDLKPGDYGEDTISLHVSTNDAYLCANVVLTSNDDNGLNEPEAEVDNTDGPGQGELAGLVNFIWWADDGDNVLETTESVLSQTTLGSLGLGATTTVTLADSQSNIWDGTGPVAGNTTKYIGKAWCFGALTQVPLDQDGLGVESPRTPANSTGGIACNGSLLGNESQTDSLTADVSFMAVQARNNDDFVCQADVCEFDEDLNILTNAGFEDPEVAAAQGWDIFATPAGGWTVEWRSDIPATFGPQNRPALAQLELHETVLGAAFEGNQYTELDSDWGGPANANTGEPASVSISREVVTVPGANYTLSYRFAPRPNTAPSENNLEARAGGVVVDTTGPTAGGAAPIAWSLRSVNFTATTTSTVIRFTDLGTANSQGTFLDDVMLNQISCPNQIQ